MEPDGYDALYQEMILDHYRQPRNPQLVADPDLQAEGFNPFCGDQVVFTAAVGTSDCIQTVGFTGRGCAISQASASMMGEQVKGRTVDEAEALLSLFKGMMQGKGLGSQEQETLGDLMVLEGVKMYPVRIKCALLAWSALQDAIAEYRRQRVSPP